MYDRRLLHPLLAGAGHVRGPDRDPFSVGKVIEESVARIETGFPLIVFPEGTRSPPGRLLPFGRIAFEIAVRAKVPLVSIGIRCDPPYLSKEVSVFRPPCPTARLTMDLLAIDAPDSLGSDSRDLQKRVENRFQAWFDGP